MKKLFPLFVFTVLLTCLSFGQSRKYDHTIPILQDVVPTEDYVARDVVVTHSNGRYTIDFYIRHDGKVNHHRAHVGEDKTFTYASYSWVSKNKVAIRLFDANSANAFELKVFGDGNGTGIEIKTDDNGKPIY